MQGGGRPAQVLLRLPLLHAGGPGGRRVRQGAAPPAALPRPAPARPRHGGQGHGRRDLPRAQEGRVPGGQGRAAQAAPGGRERRGVRRGGGAAGAPPAVRVRQRHAAGDGAAVPGGLPRHRRRRRARDEGVQGVLPGRHGGRERGAAWAGRREGDRRR